MPGVSIKLEGLGDVVQAFDSLAAEIGDKDARSKILVPAAREAMKPVLAAAQQNAPVDSGALRMMLQVEARRPTRKDRRSKYISESDTVIAAITTASGKKMQRWNEAMGTVKGRAKIERRLARAGMTAEQIREFKGFKSDARAVAQEFGTARNPEQPYLRPALEANAQSTVSRLAEILKRRIEKYKAKQK